MAHKKPGRTKAPVRNAVGRKSKAISPEVVKNQVQNGLQDALFGGLQTRFGTQLSQVDTLMVNERWYLISNMRQLLSQAYVEHGLIKTIVSVPVEDALRGGIEIKSKQLSPEQIKEIEIVMERDEILSGPVTESENWKRLFGGAGILIVTEQDPKEPLNLEALGPDSKIKFEAVDMWELYGNRQIDDRQDMLEFEDAEELEYYNFYGVQVHKSRVMRLKGDRAPSFIRPRLRGWGLSVVECFVQSINQYLKTKNLTFEVLDEFKIDVFKINGLAQTLLSPGGTQAVRNRVQLANTEKNFNKALTMDSLDDWDHKQLTFAGIADVMKEVRMQIAADLRMPISKIFGISATGFNSGEDDIENYNAMIESSIRSKCKGNIFRIVEILCQKHFGMIPDDLQIEFKPLRVLSSEQEQAVKTQKFNRLLAARQAGELTSKEFREACNHDDLLPIQVDESVVIEDEPEDEVDATTVAAPAAPKPPAPKEAK